jgi:ATP-binding protein involved in chromosome partitioning
VKVKFILGVAAGKGGVGKSSLTVNLALCLHRMGRRVGIMDADIYGPSIRKMLPEDSLPYDSEGHPGKLIPAQRHGIQLMSMSYFLKEEEAAIVRAPIANGIIKKFFHLVEWGDLDCLLIDFPPGTGDIQLTLMQEGSLSGGVVITTPQEVALQDVSKAISLFHRMQVPVLGVVENMSYFQDPLSDRRYYPFGKGGGKRLCLKEGIPFLGEIPIDGEISRCCDEGVSLFEIEGRAAQSASAFDSIAKEVWEQLVSFEKLEGSYQKNFKLLWQNGK